MTDPEERLVRRAAVRIGLLTAGLVTAVVVALSVAVGVLVVRQQDATDRALLVQSAATADDADDPPAGIWLVIDRGGRYDATPGLPASLPDTTALAAAVAGRTTEQDLRAGGRHLRILTAPRAGGSAVQAVLDLRRTDALRRHVVETTAGVGGAGVLAAVVIALVVSRRAVRPMARALGLQRSFVADASHELRTPLTLLTTRAQLLRDAVAAGATAQALDDAEGVVHDAGRLTEVVDDLLLAADPREDAERAEVDLRTLCAEVVRSASPHATGRRIALGLADGPPVHASVTAPAVRRAVVALVDNAVQHAPADGWVEVAVAVRGADAEIAVTDSGPGVDPADAAELFRRFASGRQASDRRAYGLGLALVREIAARHRGRVEVAPPDPSRGARFVLTLPRR